MLGCVFVHMYEVFFPHVCVCLCVCVCVRVCVYPGVDEEDEGREGTGLELTVDELVTLLAAVLPLPAHVII